MMIIDKSKRGYLPEIA